MAQQNQQNTYVKMQDLNAFKQELNTELNNYLSEQLGRNTSEILEKMSEMLNRAHENDQIDISTDSTSTDYDDDHDVIMRNEITSSVTPVPDPGLFSGDTKQTKLFCELCQSILNTYPYNQLL